MAAKYQDFFRVNPEGAVIIALDSCADGLLFGAVELQSGEETWLDYESKFDLDSSMVSFYRKSEGSPVLMYCVKGRQTGIITHPNRLLILWNRSRRELSVDGEPLSHGELSASAPEGITPWLFRLANWLPRWG